MPAMTVLTLAENAVKHGSGPSAKGARCASRRASTARCSKSRCGDGVGLQLGAGSGHGLSNTRCGWNGVRVARGAGIENRRGGVRAALVLPFAAVPAQEPVQ